MGRKDLQGGTGRRTFSGDGKRYLFISSAWRDGNPLRDASTLYRCIFHIVNLRAAGLKADFIPQREFSISMLDYYDCFVFHRPTPSGSLARQIDTLYRSGKQVCCDYDDLIFDQHGIMSSPRRASKDISTQSLLAAAEAHQDAMSHFSDVIVSTEPMLESVAGLAPYQAAVIHNGYCPLWLERTADAVAKARAAALATPVRIVSYFSGSSSHDADFRPWIAPLRQAMEKYPDIVLQLVGPLNIPDDALPREKIIRRGLVPYMSLPHIMATTWLALAPLDLSSRFNRCKSALKFFESGVFGIPCAASLSPDMARFGNHLFPLKEGSDLLAACDALAHPDDYRAVSERVRRFAVESCSSVRQTVALQRFFGSEGDFS